VLIITFCRYLFFGAISDVGGGDSMMKKVLAIVLSLMLLVVFAVGCKKAETPKAPDVKKDAPANPAPADKAAADKAAADKAAADKAADDKAPADKAADEKANKQLKGLFTH
jgi:cell division protein FtsN